MSRPTKQGIDYFPMDAQFDDKLELYILEKESAGLAVFVTLLQIIYQNEGYYITNGKDLFLLIKKRINADINEIESCINVMLQRGILNKKLYLKHKILTSTGIQKRYFEAAKRKKEVRVISEYLLIDVNVYENIINVNINRANACNNATKEEEEEEVKVKGEVNATDTFFDTFWRLYDKKVGKPNAIKEWGKLTKIEREKILQILPAYINSKPDKQYRKDPERFLKYKMFNDEIINSSNNGNGKTEIASEQRKHSPLMQNILNGNKEAIAGSGRTANS